MGMYLCHSPCAAIFIDYRKYFEEEKDSKRPLMKALWRVSIPTFVPAGFCQLITVFAQAAIPLLVRQLLSILEENPGQRVLNQGLPYAILIFLASMLNAFGNHRHRHLATKTGIVLRSTVVSVIYDNVLHMTPAGRSRLNSGEVTTLVAVDTQKVPLQTWLSLAYAVRLYCTHTRYCCISVVV